MLVSMTRRKRSGIFIAIEGPDGAGKTTQAAMLAEGLERQARLAVTRVREPGGTATGERVREILLDPRLKAMCPWTELLLYMASRAQLVAQVVRPALERGDCVLCDRYISSTVAYQGAGGAEVADVKEAGRIAVGGLRPDLTILLDLPAQKGLARLAKGKDRVESKDFAYHSRVRELFLQQARQGRRHWAVVDAAGSVEEVQARLREIIRRRKL